MIPCYDLSVKRRYFRNKSFNPTDFSAIKSYVEHLGVDSPRTHYLLYLIFEKGWTLRAISEVSKIDVYKLHRLFKQFKNPDDLIDFESSLSYPGHIELPTWVTDENSKYIPIRPRSPGIEPSTSRRLRQLSLDARHYRSGMAEDSIAATANSELDVLVAKLFNSYVKIAEIARACGVTPRAIRKRLEKQDL